MRRRRFLQVAGAGTAGFAFARPVAGGSRQPPSRDEGGNLYARLVRANDARLPALLAKQDRAGDRPWSGGVVRDEHGIPSPGGTAGLVGAVVAALAAPESRFTGSPDLADRLSRAARALLALQHDDGTIDLPTTNFHSPPDTAFVLEPVCAALSVIRRRGVPVSPETIAALEGFARAAGEALVVGGVHTPNHRWVVCGALAALHALFPDPRYVARIDEWLAEGIDIDADGQFSERSTSVYSPTCDRALLTVARLLDRPALLDPVRRNLEMTLFYLHANGDVATEASRRQDQYRPGSPAGYHLPYRWLAIRERNGRFAAAARLIEAKLGDALAGNLLYVLEHPALRQPLPDSAPLPDDFARAFPGSDLARIRRGRVSATVLGGNPCVLSFHKGGAVLEAVRLASAFFGKGQFIGERLATEDGAYVLAQSLTGPYYQPLPPEARHADGTIHPGDRDKRRQSEVQRLLSRIVVRESRGTCTIEFDVRETERVPVAVELAFRRGGELAGVTPVAGRNDTYLLANAVGEYRAGGDAIRFGPGLAGHTWTDLRGALPKVDALSVYLTGFTPFRTTLQIE
jgi:hypothetical protein